jgi:hypothetical protein
MTSLKTSGALSRLFKVLVFMQVLVKEKSVSQVWGIRTGSVSCEMVEVLTYCFLHHFSLVSALSKILKQGIVNKNK